MRSFAPIPPTIAIAHLGCEKNRVDTEHMLGLLVAAGYQVDTNEDLADYVIVNTCSFIEDARRESVRTIVELAEAGKRVVIAGCMAQHFQQELLDEIPEAVALIGTGDYHKIVEVIHRAENGERVFEITPEPTYIADETVPRYRTTHAAVAYVRVAEGCDYRCAFCIIPHLRGNQRSRTIESIVQECHQLASEGVQEIVLISQITTNYGLDLYGQPRLAELLVALGEVDVPWIRMHYAYPTGLTPKVLNAMKSTPNVLPYMDLPLQHAHPDVLRAMNRPWQGRVNDRVIEQIKEAVPDAVMRTTLIVGFPGETEEQFDYLLEFVQRHRFDHLGVFTFSAEEGTPAYTLPNQIPEHIKQERKERLMLLQQDISLQQNQQQIGKIVDVLIEQEHYESRALVGRSARFAPDVDGLVYITNSVDCPGRVGAMQRVLITEADAYDLHGRAV